MYLNETHHLSDLKIVADAMVKALSEAGPLPHGKCMCEKQARCYANLARLSFEALKEYYLYLDDLRDSQDYMEGVAQEKSQAAIHLSLYKRLLKKADRKTNECENINE